MADQIKKDNKALDVLRGCIKGCRVDDLVREGNALVIKLQNNTRLTLETWGASEMPIQVSVGSNDKDYYAGSFSHADGLMLFERGTLGS